MKNPFQEAREALGKDRKGMAIALDVGYERVAACDAGAVRQIPKTWRARLEAMGLNYDEIAARYATWRQEQVAR